MTIDTNQFAQFNASPEEGAWALQSKSAEGFKFRRGKVSTKSEIQNAVWLQFEINELDVIFSARHRRLAAIKGSNMVNNDLYSS